MFKIFLTPPHLVVLNWCSRGSLDLLNNGKTQMIWRRPFGSKRLQYQVENTILVKYIYINGLRVNNCQQLNLKKLDCFIGLYYKGQSESCFSLLLAVIMSRYSFCKHCNYWQDGKHYFLPMCFRVCHATLEGWWPFWIPVSECYKPKCDQEVLRTSPKLCRHRGDGEAIPERWDLLEAGNGGMNGT